MNLEFEGTEEEEQWSPEVEGEGEGFVGGLRASPSGESLCREVHLVGRSTKCEKEEKRRRRSLVVDEVLSL